MQMQSPITSSAASAPPPNPNQSPDEKILHDLSSVTTQISLLTSMLHALPRPFAPSSIASNASLLTVLGFLEACVPRMIDLIQAGSSGGMIGEETLVKTLEVNDELCRVLKDVEDPSGLWEREAGKVSGGGGLEAKFDAFGLGNDGGNDGGNGGGGAGRGLTTQNSGLEDLLGGRPAVESGGKAQSSTLDDLLAMSSDNKVSAAEASDHVDSNGGGKDEDDFDNFFGERMEGKI